uniref:DUSP domain-containing protein n=1 Tax=Caenorhabditis japonica TaxID=281687 RepID=A0A8R1HX14_CAEJA
MPSPEDVPMEDGTNDENQPEQQQQLKVALTRQELVALIDQIDRTPMVVGETWCLVSQKWWTALNKAVRDGYVEDVPAIDNTPISDCVNGFFYLKQHMGEGIDYTPVPAPIFEKLSKMFQLEDDRRDYITRKVVMKNGEKVLEVYPRVIHVTLARSRDVKGDVILQPDDTMETLSQRVRTELALAPNENIRIYVSSGNSQELIDTSAPLDSYFDTVQKVIVDTEVEGEWFFRAANAPRSLFGPQNSSTEGDSELEEEEVDEQEEEEENEADVDLDDCKNLTNARAKIGTTLSTIKRNVLWPLCALWFHVHDFWFYFCQMWPEEVRSTVAFFFGWWILRPPSGTSARLGFL